MSVLFSFGRLHVTHLIMIRPWWYASVSFY